MSEPAYEYVDQCLEIMSGIDSREQETSHMNGTLQEIPEHDLCFTVETHVGIPAEVVNEEMLAAYLKEKFSGITELTGRTVAFVITTGPIERPDA